LEYGATEVAEIESVRVPTLDTMVSVPVNVPAEVGAKVAPTPQDPPGATGEVQVLITVRLGSPVSVTLETVSGP
jgi:hypothetical protein